MWHIQRQSFSKQQAKFYAAQVLLALEYLHENNIVYRDLKLDNILLGLDGYIKLADYGLCKEGIGYESLTTTFCGTPEFMAPEIISGQPYSRTVDWWAFGVLIYEMVLGQSPFSGSSEDEIFRSILHASVKYPITMDLDAHSLVKRLLVKDPKQRLGASAADAKDIKQHPYFRDVKFDELLAKTVQPPYMPKLVCVHIHVLVSMLIFLL